MLLNYYLFLPCEKEAWFINHFRVLYLIFLWPLWSHLSSLSSVLDGCVQRSQSPTCLREGCSYLACFSRRPSRCRVRGKNISTVHFNKHVSKHDDLLCVITHRFYPGSFWHITDLHWDPTYRLSDNPELVCASSSKRPALRAGKFGDYVCDSPWHLINSSVYAMKHILPDPDFILWTGCVSVL